MSRPLPYSPMHGPQKALTQEDMWSTLSKHCPIPSQTPQVVATPKAEPPPLVWEKPVKTGEISGYMLSADGAFSVSKDSVRGAPMYSAWKRNTDPATNLGVRLTLAEAQHLCELAR